MSAEAVGVGMVKGGWTESNIGYIKKTSWRPIDGAASRDDILVAERYIGAEVSACVAPAVGHQTMQVCED